MMLMWETSLLIVVTYKKFLHLENLTLLLVIHPDVMDEVVTLEFFDNDVELVNQIPLKPMGPVSCYWNLLYLQ